MQYNGTHLLEQILDFDNSNVMSAYVRAKPVQRISAWEFRTSLNAKLNVHVHGEQYEGVLPVTLE